MTNPSYVCAHHAHPLMVGAVVSDTRRVAKERTAGNVFLPVTERLMREQALGGFLRRQWGPGGWVFDQGRGEPGSPMALEVPTGLVRLHWACGVTQAISSRAGGASGKLQLVADRSRPGGLSSGLTVLEQPEPFRLAVGQQPLVIYGSSQLNNNLPGFLPLQLWGVCRGVTVLWSAVTATLIVE